ncbi:MAG: SMUG2 DNA glycosylase family protein [Chitinophagales bacterium]|nr:SMUG2 DNA glycosylase family protein [Chitinophagales bacterium]
MADTIADKVIRFNQNLEYTGKLPQGFKVLNPYRDNPETMKVMREFYFKYYHDNNKRKFIVGINPSRHGAGVTGVPFTDTKRLESKCGIRMHSAYTHEVSSVFLYDMITAYGGPEIFYKRFYINSPFPLAITQLKKGGKWLNANYYDNEKLFKMVKGYMIESMQKHIALGLDTTKVFSLGVKNAQFLERLNQEVHLFDEVVALEHPRFIQQYKSKDKDIFIEKYISELGY